MRVQGKIQNKKVIWSSPEHVRYFIQKHEGRRVWLSVEKAKRSLNQNSFYWAYLHALEDETGNLADDLHEYCKRKFLPPRFIQIDGKSHKIPGTTTGLDKAGFSDYLDKIAAWSGIPLPTKAELEQMGYVIVH